MKVRLILISHHMSYTFAGNSSTKFGVPEKHDQIYSVPVFKVNQLEFMRRNRVKLLREMIIITVRFLPPK